MQTKTRLKAQTKQCVGFLIFWCIMIISCFRTFLIFGQSYIFFCIYFKCCVVQFSTENLVDVKGWFWGLDCPNCPNMVWTLMIHTITFIPVDRAQLHIPMGWR